MNISFIVSLALVKVTVCSSSSPSASTSSPFIMDSNPPSLPVELPSPLDGVFAVFGFFFLVFFFDFEGALPVGSQQIADGIDKCICQW
jgi:hypothetical protein